MAIRWPITSTASTVPVWVFAHRAIWLRLFPMRATSRVRSRSTSACGTVQVRARPIDRRTRSDSVKPAERALGVPLRTLRVAGADLHPNGATGAHGAPFPCRGSEGAQPPPALRGTREVWPRRVGWLTTSNGRKPALGGAAETASRGTARNSVRRAVAGILPGLLVGSLKDGEGAPPGAPAARSYSGLPLPLGDRRSSLSGDPTARSFPELPPDPPETASEPVAEKAATSVQVPAHALRPARYPAQSSISRRRRSNRSVRRYAASTLFWTTCASAASTTSRGWSVSSAAQSRNDDRNPCGTAAIPFCWSNWRSCGSASGVPPSRAKTSRVSPRPEVRASPRISMARGHSGTRCSFFAFMRVAGTVHAPPVRSISDHTAHRTSPHLAAVSTRNSKASLATGIASEERTFASAKATSRCGKARMCRTTASCGPRTDPTRSAGLSVLYSIRHGPFEHRADALAQEPGRRRLDMPDRSEDLEHVAARHLRDRRPPDARKGVAPQARHPDMSLPRVAPPGPLLFHDPLGGLGKCRHPLGAASLGERIAALAGQLPVGPRLLPGLGERDQSHASEPEVPPPPANHQPLDPASGSARLDEEVEPVAVAVSAGRGRAHERGRKRFVGMATLRLGPTARVGHVTYVIHSIIIWGMERDGKGRLGECEMGKCRYNPMYNNDIRDYTGCT